MNKDLHLDDGSILKWFHRTFEHFFNKTTIIYGRRESGKSTIVIEILFLLKDYISIPFIISQSNAADFIGRVPKHCIKTSLTKEWLEEFLIAQKGRAELYNTANDIRTLKALFDKIKGSQSDNMEKILLALHYCLFLRLLFSFGGLFVISRVFQSFSKITNHNKL